MQSSRRVFILSVIRNIILISLITASAAALFARYLNLLSPDAFLPLILTLVTLLAIGEVVKSISSSTEQNEIHDIRDTVTRIERATLGENVVTAGSPETIDDFVSLWGGFKGYMYVYNPNYKAEVRPGAGTNEELTRQLWIPRYTDPNFKMAYYLFLTGDDEGRRELDQFTRMMKELEKKCPQIKSKLQVRALDNRASSEDVVAVMATRRGIEASILELRAPGLARGAHSPVSYLIIPNPEIRKRLREAFDPAWNEGKKIPIFD